MSSMDAIAGEFTKFYYQTFDANRSGLSALYVSRGGVVLCSGAQTDGLTRLPLQRPTSMLTFEGSQVQGAQAITEKLQVS